MKGLSKILLRGASTWPLLLSGLLIAFIVFRKRVNTSAMEYDLLIQKILTDNGYSPNMARMIAAVSRHETGNYSSSVFKTLNNMFGMRFPRERQTTALYESDSKYSVYTDAADSVRDMVLYLNARRYPFNFNSVRDLVETMKEKGYFEDSIDNYLQGVERALPKVATA